MKSAFVAGAVVTLLVAACGSAASSEGGPPLGFPDAGDAHAAHDGGDSGARACRTAGAGCSNGDECCVACHCKSDPTIALQVQSCTSGFCDPCGRICETRGGLESQGTCMNTRC